MQIYFVSFRQSFENIFQTEIAAILSYVHNIFVLFLNQDNIFKGLQI